MRQSTGLMVLTAFALLGTATVAMPAAGAARAADERVGVVAPDVAAAVEEGPLSVVVALRPDPVPPREVASRAALEGRAARIAAAQAAALDRVPPGSVRSVHRFDNVPAMVATIDDAAAIEALAADPAVVRIDLDVGGTALLSEVVSLVGADVRHTSGIDGSGVTVAVIDSGVEGAHPDLASSVAVDQACFGYDGGDPLTGFCPDGSEEQVGLSSDTPPPAVDGSGHGTHVAGTIASDGVLGPVGVAPGATVLAIKSLDDTGGFTSFTRNVVEALDHLIDNPQLGVDIVNLSLGTGAEFVGDCDTATAYTIAGAAAVDTLRAQGVTVFAAAGGTSSGTTMPAPACLSGVISVGASDDLDVMAGWSNSNSATDVVAPGVGVLAADIPGTASTRSGTSMASAVAAGCAALLIDAAQVAGPASIEARLETSPVQVTDPKNGLTFPRVECAADLLPTPTVTPGAAAVVEGVAGSSVVINVPVELSAPTIAAVTVDWVTAAGGSPGLATEGVDFVAGGGAVTFAPGETVKSVPVTVLGDDVDEPPAYLGEWGFVQFSNVSANATLDPSFFGLGLFIIVDDDDPPVVAPGLTAVEEGDPGSSVVAHVPVTLSNPSAETVTVDWVTAAGGSPGLATEGVDFVAGGGAVTFAPGETVKSVPVTVLGDDVDEPPAYLGEWGFVQFSNVSANATLDPSFFGLGLFIIVDDD